MGVIMVVTVSVGMFMRVSGCMHGRMIGQQGDQGA